MKKLNPLFITFFLLIAFTCTNDCLFGIVNDINGQGNSTWGMSKAQVKGRFAKRIKLKDVAVTQRADFLIINYRKGQVTRKRYDFDKNRLYKITLTYSHTGRRIVKTYNDKYKPYTKIENNTYVWKFPSTIITYKQGTNRAVFIDRSYASTLKPAKHIDDIRIGMSLDQVRKLMGTPRATATASGGITTYRYNKGVITFQNRRVTKIEKVSGVYIQPGVVPTQGGIDMIKIGMSSAEVERIMGKPLSITALGNLVVYRYNAGTISLKFQRVAKIDKNTSSKQIKIIKKK
ncbi:MAG: hypothetical protein KAT34_10915 [Candidatus Aminicenantes bacterium]|nr:hypothetical protein [Candidatus Aminicenantes bacterium]